MLTKSIMTPDVKFCGADASLGAVSRIMAKHGCGIVRVVDGQQKGIDVITDRDVCLAVATRIRYPDELPVGEVMTAKVHTCSPDDDVRQALALMKTHAGSCRSTISLCEPPPPRTPSSQLRNCSTRSSPFARMPLPHSGHVEMDTAPLRQNGPAGDEER